MKPPSLSFSRFLLLRQNKLLIAFSLLWAIAGLLLLRHLFPSASYYSDSFTWVGNAHTGQPVSMRPIGYSKALIFFRTLGATELPVVVAQYMVNLFANLLLFFSFVYWCRFNRAIQIVLYLLLILNPFYLFYSNYISSDAFFNALTVIWFTLLLWVIRRPGAGLFALHLLAFALLFELRYNAIILPVVTVAALLFARTTVRFKAVGSLLVVSLTIGLVTFITAITRQFTHTETFSAFSGWQLANDALHIMRHDSVDRSKLKDPEVRSVYDFASNYFKTQHIQYPDTIATAFYMWSADSPLKQYMKVFPKREKSYFATWNALGPVYSKFGKAIILQRPVTYFRHFIWPNAGMYYFAPLEIYETYMENRDTLPKVVTKYYAYQTNKVPPQHPAVYRAVFPPMKYLFTTFNTLFIVFAATYLVRGRWRQQPKMLNQFLLCFTLLLVINFGFVVLLAPSVLRYHIFILTLAFPFTFWLLQTLVRSKTPV